MAIRITKAFALSGDKTTIPTDSTGTELSFDRGWTSAYELEVGVDAGARDIDRGQHNFLFNAITSNIKEWQEQTLPEYQSSIAYAAHSQVMDSGTPFVALQATTTGTATTDEDYFVQREITDRYSKTVSITMTDATYTLSASENLYGTIEIVGTLAGTQDLVVSNLEKKLVVKNSTGQAVKVKTSAGTGVHVPDGERFELYCDGTNILTSGVSNRVLIKSLALATTGTFSYPYALTQSNFDKIEFNFAVTTQPEAARTNVILTSDRVDAYPSTWAAVAFYGSSSDTVSLDIDYTSTTSFSVSNSVGDAALSDVYGYLKDGVTY